MANTLETDKPIIQRPSASSSEILVPFETEVTNDLSEHKGYFEKVEEVKPSAVTDDVGNTILVPTDNAVVYNKTTLPLTEEQLKKGLQHKIIDSIKWLAEWCVLRIKKAHSIGSQVFYKK